jgi:hypothetical protein
VNLSPINASRPTHTAGPAPAARRADNVGRFDTELVLSFRKPAETEPKMTTEGAGPDRRVTFLRKLFSF